MHTRIAETAAETQEEKMSEDVKKKPGRIPTLSMMKKMKSGTLEAEDLESFPKNNRWAFNAGKTFAGNPKYLFIYINKYPS